MDETPHSRRPGRLAARLTAAALAAAALAAPAGASAATAGVQDRVLAYTAAPGEANRLSVGFDYQTGYFVLSDAGAPVTAGPGCKATSANTVACAQSLVGRLALDLGDGDDSATSHLVLTPTAIAGGAGNDTLTGALPDESLDGGDGDDRLTGGAGADRLDGGAGIDSFSAGAGADQLLARDQVAETLTCGSEADTVTADAADAAQPDCEQVDVPAPPAGPADPGAADPADPADPAGPADAAPAAPTPTLPQATVTLRGDVIGVPIACPAEILGGCAGTLTITVDEDVAERRRVSGARRRRTTKLGQQRFRIAAGEQKTVQVRLSRRASRKLKKTKKPKKGRGRRINIEVTVNGPTGPVTTTRSLTLLERRNSRSRPPRKRR